MKKIFLILNFIFISCFIASYAQAGVKEPGLGNFSDMNDSVFLTPTSSTPYSTFEVTYLTSDKWIISNKKFDGVGGPICFYKRKDVKVPWKTELGVLENLKY